MIAICEVLGTVVILVIGYICFCLWVDFGKNSNLDDW